MVEIWTCKQIERVFLGRPVPARPRASGVNHVLHAAGPPVVAGVCSCGGTDDSTTSRRQGKENEGERERQTSQKRSPLPCSVRPPLTVAQSHMARRLHGQSDLTDGARLRFSTSNSSSSSSSLFLLAAPADDASLCRIHRWPRAATSAPAWSPAGSWPLRFLDLPGVAMGKSTHRPVHFLIGWLFAVWLLICEWFGVICFR